MKTCHPWTVCTWLLGLYFSVAHALPAEEVTLQLQCDRCKCGSGKSHTITDETFVAGRKKPMLDMKNCWDCPSDFGDCKLALKIPSERRRSNTRGIFGAHSIYRYYTTAKDVGRRTDIDRSRMKFVKTGSFEDCESPQGVDSQNRGMFLGFIVKIFALGVKKPLVHTFNINEWYPRDTARLSQSTGRDYWQPPLTGATNVILNFFEYKDPDDDGTDRRRRWSVWDITQLRKPPQNVAQFFFLPYRKVRSEYADARKFFETVLPQRELVKMLCHNRIGDPGPCDRGVFAKYLFEAEAICMENQLHDTVRSVRRKLASIVKRFAKESVSDVKRTAVLDRFYDYLNRLMLKKAKALNGGVVHSADAQVSRDCIAKLLATEYNGLRDFAASLVEGHLPRLGLYHSQINLQIQAATGGSTLIPVAWDRRGLDDALDRFYGPANRIYNEGPLRSPHDFIAGLS